ncbi:MAG: glucuronate isomerase [Anaerolineales bacterium]
MEHDYRFFDPNPPLMMLARDLYAQVKDLPIISPHGHVDPALFSEPDQRFADPVALLIQPDHYLLRMLYSQGINYETLLDHTNPQCVWQLFADHFYLFRGTPSGIWQNYTLETLFGITEKLNGKNAVKIYEKIQAALRTPEFEPRTLYKRMKIEVLATTDPAYSALTHHQKIRASGWEGRIIPSFRPDDLIDLLDINWLTNVERLSQVSKIDVHDFHSFNHALEVQCQFFKAMGATAIDCSVLSPRVQKQSLKTIEAIFQRALLGEAGQSDAITFTAHMLYEMARMSVDVGMVMQLHPGVYRNHNTWVYEQFGADMGFDIPVCTEFTRNLQPLLAEFGNHPKFSLVLFTLDESTYGRELAPLAGAYPAVKLGPPWWFNDSWDGMHRYFEQVMATAGIYNTVGFNDDTRAFLSIPARHDLWRRACANWLAGLCTRGMIDRADAEEMMTALAVNLAKEAYHL